MSNTQRTSTAKSSSFFKLLIIIVLLAASMWYALRDVDWDNLWQAILSVNLGWLVAAVAIGMLSHVARGYRWRLLIPSGSSVRLLDAVSATVIGYMMNNIIPRSGELARPYVLARREGRSMSSLLATIVVERILDGIMLALLFVVVLLVERNRLDQILQQAGIHYSATGVVMALALPIIVLIIVLVIAVRTTFGDRLLDWLERRLPKRFIDKLRYLLHEFRAGIAFGGTRGLIELPLWSILIWFGYAMSFYFGFRAFGFDTAYGLGIWEMVPMLALTSAAITVAPTPGGFGFYHAVCKAALVTLYGVTDDAAVAFAIVLHAAGYFTVIIAGALFSMRESISLGDTLRQAERSTAEVEATIDPATPR
jgi:uncharacterized protein (TIRG00374 family)